MKKPTEHVNNCCYSTRWESERRPFTSAPHVLRESGRFTRTHVKRRKHDKPKVTIILLINTWREREVVLTQVVTASSTNRSVRQLRWYLHRTETRGTVHHTKRCFKTMICDCISKIFWRCSVHDIPDATKYQMKITSRQSESDQHRDTRIWSGHGKTDDPITTSVSQAYHRHELRARYEDRNNCTSHVIVNVQLWLGNYGTAVTHTHGSVSKRINSLCLTTHVTAHVESDPSGSVPRDPTTWIQSRCQRAGGIRKHS